MAHPPGSEVLAAFGISDEPERLSGGMGGSFRCGGLVLKHEDLAMEAEWKQELLSRLQGDAFQVPRPIPSRSGGWTFQRWTAAEWLEARTPFGSAWPERFAASREFHQRIAGAPRPDFLDVRTDSWALADRVSLGLEPWQPHPLIAPVWERLKALGQAESLSEAWQVVHGDISGNFLIGDAGPPIIIDFTPYWRPSGFGEAVMAVDGALWEGAELADLVEIWSPSEAELRQLPRAAERRLLEVDCHHRTGRNPDSTLAQSDRYRELAELIQCFF